MNSNQPADEHQDPGPRTLDFAGGVWHGAFLAGSMALSDINTVIPALITELTGSAVWVGGFAALIAAAGTAPQVVVARFVEPLARKRPVLLLAIYLRVATLAGLGLFIGAVGRGRPGVLLWGLVGLLGFFAAGGALGNVPFTDLIGRVIPAGRRGAFFASRQALGSLVALGASAMAGVVLFWGFPGNYAALFLLSSAALALASVGLWFIHEPPGGLARPRQPWLVFFRSLGKPLRDLRRMALTTWATGLGLMAIPFYIVAARQDHGAPAGVVAMFIAAMIAGAVVGNLAWGYIVDRHGGRRMVLVCVIVSALTPATALLSNLFGWPVLVGVAALVGATTSGRRVGFPSALLELAPPDRRATYSAAYALLGLPVAVMPLLGGVIASRGSFNLLFILTAAALIGAVATAWWWNQGTCGPSNSGA